MEFSKKHDFFSMRHTDCLVSTKKAAPHGTAFLKIYSVPGLLHDHLMGI
jgi:hypothetical protein